MIGGKKTQRGFTLVEMMVAVAVFATASIIITDLFLSFNRSQRRAQSSQAIQSDARVLMSNIVDKARSGEIDYASYPSATISNPETELRIIGVDGLSYVIRRSDTVFSNTVCPSAASTPCLEISADGGTSFSPMTSERLKVVGVQFYITPVESPTVQSAGVYTYNVQPSVTMVIGLQGSTTQAAEQGTTFIQTTVSSRVLLR